MSRETGISSSVYKISVDAFSTICAESGAEFQPSSTLNISCYQLCIAAAAERFLSSECIPAECLCLVCCHAACLIYAITYELLLWFSVCHSHTSNNVSAPINQVNISVLQLFHTTKIFWY